MWPAGQFVEEWAFVRQSAMKGWLDEGRVKDCSLAQVAWLP
jgi:hypothetical protein